MQNQVRKKNNDILRILLIVFTLIFLFYLVVLFYASIQMEKFAKELFHYIFAPILRCMGIM